MKEASRNEQIARLLDYNRDLDARTTEDKVYIAGIRERIDVQLKRLGTSLDDELAKQGGAA